MSSRIVTGVGEPEDDGQTPLDPDESRGLLLDWVANRADLNLAEEENIALGMAWGSALARDVQRRSYLDAIRAADARDYRALIDFVRR